jgi:dTDP-4-dehydrorhamnose 3,5-epimerase
MVGTVKGPTLSVTALSIPGLFILESPVHVDDRGLFREWYREDDLAAAGVQFELAQANLSRSDRNVVRGMHYSLAAQGQAKVVTCVHGAMDDVIVDIRIGSPTFGRVETIELDESAGVSVVVPAGVAHGFVVTSDAATLAYLLSSRYDPDTESEFNPFDPAVNIAWRLSGAPRVSPRDNNAPTLNERQRAGQLPRFLT